MDNSRLRDSLQLALGADYRVERELGGGGMSHVFVAEELLQGRRVVVKVLSPELAGTVDAERFRREIHILTQLHHAAIVPVLGMGPAGSLLCYTMPLLAGESLRTVMHRERQLPLAIAVGYARDIADALSYAHRHNVVHRDIKPENIIVDGGHAVVMDFGISRAIERSADIESLTATGFTLGTPRYMSPEQAAAEKHIDGRSDIYSLACVLFEMLVGEPPFPGTNSRLLISRHLRSAPPSPRASRPDLPMSIERALLRALAKAPADRYDTSDSFAAALADGADEAPSVAVAARPPAGDSRSRRTMALGAGVAALIAVVTLVVARCTR